MICSLTYYQVALLALVPKNVTVFADQLARATTFPVEHVRTQLQGLIELGELVAVDGGYRLPEKSHE